MQVIKSLNDLSVHLTHLVSGRLWLKVLLGLFLGIGAGLLLNPSFEFVDESLTTKISPWLNLPGEIFMKLVQMVMIPLIFASIISGIVSNVSDNLRKFGLRLLLYFLFTTIVAITIGLVLAIVFQPGYYIQEVGGIGSEASAVMNNTGSAESFHLARSISNLIPVNPLEAMLTGEMLSIVIFTVIMGIAITQLEERFVSPLMRMVEAIQKISMIVVGWAMRLIPFAVFGLIGSLVSTTGTEVFLGLGYYVMVVVLGLLALMAFYLIIYTIIKRENPFHFIKQIKDPLLLAFSTASSAAVMPLSMKTADEKLGVSSKISDFVIPIGATINMDGTALYQCITVIFMMQIYGMDFVLADTLLIMATVVSASIGTPAIPGGGVIILATVLQGAGIPSDGILIIIGIDRILGMLRTTVNVTGDLTATVVFDKWFGSESLSK